MDRVVGVDWNTDFRTVSIVLPYPLHGTLLYSIPCSTKRDRGQDTPRALDAPVTIAESGSGSAGGALTQAGTIGACGAAGWGGGGGGGGGGSGTAALLKGGWRGSSSDLSPSDLTLASN